MKVNPSRRSRASAPVYAPPQAPASAYSTVPETQSQAEAAATGKAFRPPYDPRTSPGNLMQGSPWSPKGAPASSQPANINQPWSAWNQGRGQQLLSPPGNTITPGYGVRGPANPPGSPASYEMNSGMALTQPEADGGDYGAGMGMPFDAQRWISVRKNQTKNTADPVSPAQLFSGARGLNAQSLTNYWNRWREYLNPIAGLDIRRVVALIKYYQLGLWADYQWTLFWCLRRDATLIHLMKRRVSAILSRTIQHVPCDEEDLPEGFTTADAEAQCETLKRQYALVQNWREALTFLEHASVHGYAHLEKIRNEDGDITRLECIDQWFWCKKSVFSDWLYNAAALQTNNGETVDLSRFIIRDETRCVFMGDAILAYYVRLGMCEKNWDAFVEIFGIPRPVVTGPDPRVVGAIGFDMQALKSAADSITNGGTGALPFGSAVAYPNETRQNQPFEERADWLVTKITQMLTGSSLTSETKSGSGTLAGNAHSDSWDEICAGESDAIGEVLDTHLSTDILLRYHPGEPRLCKTILGTKEQQDSAKACGEVLQLFQAGLETDPEQVEAMSGWKVARIAAQPTGDGSAGASDDVLKNRMGHIDPVAFTEQRYAHAAWRDIQPKLRALWNRAKESGDNQTAFRVFQKGLIEITETMENQEAASVLFDGMMHGFQEGLKQLQPA